MNQNKTNIFQELIKHEPHFLDRPLEELLPLRFMGEIAVNAYRGLIKHLDDLPLAQEDREAKLRDGQDAGKALLMIEARIGELILKEPKIPSKKKRGKIGRSTGIPSGEPPKHERLGMTSHQMDRAKSIATHPEEVAEVIKEAEENEDIPTKTAVLSKIAYKRELARKMEQKPKDIKLAELRGEIKATEKLARDLSAQLLILMRFKEEIKDRVYEAEIRALATEFNVLIKRLKTFIGGKQSVKQLKG